MSDKKTNTEKSGDLKLDTNGYRFAKRPAYLQESTKTNGDTKHINTKVSSTFYEEWQAAKDAAEEYGFEVNTTALVRQALANAITEIASFIEAQDKKPMA